MNEVLQGTLVNLGVFLLYGVPLFVYLIKDLINGLRDLLRYHYVLAFSSSLYVLMLYLYFAAYVPFTIYFVGFNLVFFILDRLTLDRARSFMLSIYICYAVSVLWEWPIQIVFSQNPDALILSLCRAVAIPLYLVTVKKMGWRPNKFFLKTVLILLVAGLVIAFCLKSGADPYLVHFYRVPWFTILILTVIGSNEESLNKLRSLNTFEPGG